MIKDIKTENVVTQIRYSIGKAVEEIKQSLAYIDRLQSDNLVRRRINTDRQIISYQKYLNNTLSARLFGKNYTYEDVYLKINYFEKNEYGDHECWRDLKFSKTLFKSVELHDETSLRVIEDRLEKLLWLFTNYEYNNDEVVLDISDLELIKFYKRETADDYYIEFHKYIHIPNKESKAVVVGSEKTWAEINDQKIDSEEDR